MGLAGGARSGTALLFVAAAVVGLAAGCGPKPVAVVNGKALPEREFLELCETATQVDRGAGTVGIQVLAQWIRNTLMEEEARRHNVYPSEKDLEARLEAYRKQAAFEGQNLEEILRARGMTLETLKRDLLTQMLFENVLFRGVTVSEQEIRQEFERSRHRFTQPERVKISQITVESEEKAKQAQKDLGANTLFSVVADTYSKDRFAQQGGSVPDPLPRRVPPGYPVAQEVVDRAFRMKPGEISDPIRVGATWVIVRVDDRIPEKQPKYEDVRELVSMALRQQKAQNSPQVRENQRALMELTQRAKIEIHRPEYQILRTQFQNLAPPPQSAGAPAPPPG